MPQKKQKTDIKYYHNFHKDVNKYFSQGKTQNFPKPELCPICQKISTCLIGHGYYYRNAIDGKNWFRIPIKIWKCKNQKSGGYISIQPTFLLPYKQYIFSIIYLILYMCIVEGNLIKNSIEKNLITSVNTSYQTVQHWIRGIKSTANKWISLLQSENEIKPNASLKIKMENISDTKYMLELLAVYFDGSDMEKEHEKLLLKYNGSPLTPIPVNRKRIY